MITEFFIDTITDPGEVRILEKFLDLLTNVDAITQATWEECWDWTEDELGCCYDCNEMKYNCSCDPLRGREYNDEASYE